MRLLRRAYVIFNEGGIWLFISRSWKYFQQQIIKWKVLLPLLYFLRNFFTRFISITPGLVLFGFTSSLGGNSGHVYRTTVESDVTGIEPTWITDNQSLYEKLEAEGFPVIYQWSFQGQLAILKAEVACYDGHFRHALPNRLTKIKIRHEVPIKHGSETAKEAVTPTDVPRHDYVVTTSEFLAEKQFAYHRARKDGDAVRRDQFQPLGFPRNDMLFNPSKEIYEQWNTFVRRDQYEQVILYAPTRRRHDEYKTENTDLFPFSDFDLEQLGSLLEELDAILLVRLHPSDARRVEGSTEDYQTRHSHDTLSDFLDELCSYDRIRVASTKDFQDTNEILQFTDILVTDYSTVYHTFLLLDRPIIFIPYDYEYFRQSFGFKYDYYEHLPGPAIDSFSTFCEYLSTLSEGSDPHNEQRAELRRKIHDHPNGSSTERTIEFIRRHCHKN